MSKVRTQERQRPCPQWHWFPVPAGPVDSALYPHALAGGKALGAVAKAVVAVRGGGASEVVGHQSRASNQRPEIKEAKESISLGNVPATTEFLPETEH